MKVNHILALPWREWGCQVFFKFSIDITGVVPKHRVAVSKYHDRHQLYVKEMLLLLLLSF
jgi:hypothetical protein